MIARWKEYLILGGVAVTCSAFVSWRVHVSGARHPLLEAVAYDVSQSSMSGCAAVVGIAKQAINSPGLPPNSELLLIASGDSVTANEPVALGKWQIPWQTKVTDGGAGMEKTRATFLESVKSACEGARRTMVSPIFLTVKSGLDQLRAAGCGDTMQCRLWVITDGEETEEAGIKGALRRTGLKSSLPSPLDNTNLSVRFCGLAETVGSIKGSDGREVRQVRRTSRSLEELTDTWSKLFTERSTVQFAPYCSK